MVAVTVRALAHSSRASFLRMVGRLARLPTGRGRLRKGFESDVDKSPCQGHPVDEGLQLRRKLDSFRVEHGAGLLVHCLRLLPRPNGRQKFGRTWDMQLRAVRTGRQPAIARHRPKG